MVALEFLRFLVFFALAKLTWLWVASKTRNTSVGPAAALIGG